MLKRILAITLSILMLTSVSAFAATSTDANGKITRVDDFESISVDTVNKGDSAMSLDVLNEASKYMWVTVKSETGRDGKVSNVLQNYPRQDNFAMVLPKFNGKLTAPIHQMSYDIKFTAFAEAYLMPRGTYSTKNDLFTFTKTGDVNSGSGTKLGTYQTNTWYHVECYVTSNGTNGYTKGWLIAPDGTTIYSESTLVAQDEQAMSLVGMGSSAAGSTTVSVDNVKHITYENAKSAPVITAAPVEQGVAVEPGLASMSVTLDQAIATDSSAATLTVDGNTQACTVAIDKSKPYTYTITFPAPLEGGKSYTLDLTGLSNGSRTVGSGATYAFSTAAGAIAVGSTTPENGATKVPVTTKAMTVNFTRAATNYPSTVTITGGTSPITATVSKVSDTQFTLNWTEELASLTAYTVAITGFEDSSENSVNETVSFTTENTGIEKFEDSFETASLIADGASYNNGSDQSGSILTMEKGSVDSTVTELALVDGYTQGKKALQFTTGSDTSKTYLDRLRTTQKFTFTDDNRYIVTYRFRLDDAADYDTAKNLYGSDIWLGMIIKSTGQGLDYSKFPMTIQTNTNGKPVVCYQNNAAAGVEISEDKWYNIIWSMEKGHQAMYFVDEATGEIVYSKADNFDLTSTRTDKETWSNYIVPVIAGITQRATGQYRNVNQTFTIDDFTLWEIEPGKATQALALSGDVNENVTNENATLTFTFNQPVMEENMAFELYKSIPTAGTTLNERDYVVPAVKYLDFCKMEVSFPNLTFLTDYTVNYSGVTALSDADFGADKATAKHEFETTAPDDAFAAYGDVETTGLTNGSVMTVNVYSDSAKTVDFISGFYNRSFPAQLNAVVLTENVELNAGENQVEITLDKNVYGDYVKVFAWEDMTTLVPLMEEYKVLTPADTLDILFIGSSLSEDSTRMFDDVLEAAGEETGTGRKINVTTKFVGGGGFNYHARNLRNEVNAGLADAYKNGNMTAISEYVEAQKAIMNAQEGTEEEWSRRLYTTFRNGTKDADSADDSIMLSALLEKQYDFISIQPSANAYKMDSVAQGTEEEDFVAYEAEIAELTSLIREFQPSAEIVMFQTWTLASGNKNNRLNFYNNLIKPYVDRWAATGGNVEGITEENAPMVISPVGYAFYLADEFLSWAGTMYNLDAGDNSAAAKDSVELSDKFNTSAGLHRDANHASLYGTFLADAVWYELFTGKKVSPGTAQDPAIKAPTGVGPKFDKDGNVENSAYTYFTITAEEHHQRLTDLAEIAHKAVSEYNGLRRMK